MAPAVLVMAKAPRPGEVKTLLEPLLGPDGCARLQAALIGVATGWAHEVAPGNVFVAHAPDDGLRDVGALVPPRTELFAQEGAHLGERLVAATAQAFALGAGPLIVIGTDLPVLQPFHAAEALDDLQEGCQVSLGPAQDGGYYLIALDAPHPEVFALPAEAWGGPEVFELTLRAITEAGLAFGLLRFERDLDRPADARALLLDPRLADPVADALRQPAPPAAS